ncbi:LOW QUALITY PROTEIN: putative F-box protein At1g55070 [Arabidopsis lyrata subsp. lyrata]|uniref:LOW QUALITY PROTEIN: putative F-box protein At1g55070 n=1 Tax=Arabidopsis lyrata subsp. lyrata TaxID=81972 RepID=UPI000A29D78A|nr:LOW QUALITY PROTEIN: putative F-box protein At1g55070 [Arabidopsis lyrata subsp. lyrata]|eukprot:XP_020866223.1 LOW QUALITY PROTEIN: putative F-box protein At1g55070 [Arabidopsis lyrata subsp. lyrata]
MRKRKQEVTMENLTSKSRPMRKRKQQVTEENLTLTVSSSGPNKRSVEEYFDRIPVDLVIKILSRLFSGKYMAQSRCVCNLWSSIIRRPNYNQLFPINSPDPPPRLLFTFVAGEKLYFYSAPEPQKPDQINNSSLAATLHHTCSRNTDVSKVCLPLRGLVCHQRMEENHIVSVISNPITGESVTSPKVKTDGIEAKNYFGYDPIGNKFKVLCLTWSHRGTLQHQVLTLGTEKLWWRKIPCCISYSPRNDEICINGVLYYTASANDSIIVCFNVRSEKFDFITRRPEKFYLMKRTSTLINYKGKLGLVDTQDYDDGFVLWVLEDSDEHKWSKHILVTPLQWNAVHAFVEPYLGLLLG